MSDVPDYKRDSTRVPDTKLAELARRECMMDCEINVSKPEFVHDVDKWAILDRAELDCCEFDGDNHDHLICHFKTTTPYDELTHRATRTDPAAYERHDLRTHVSIWWDMESKPEVNIEIDKP